MSSRVVKAFRVVKCLTKNSSSVFSREALHPSCNRIRIATTLVNGRTSFCSVSNGVSQTTEDQKICIESTVFTENVSNLSTSIGLTHNPECLKPALVHRSYLTAHASTLKQQHKDNDQLSFLGLQTAKRFLGELLLERFPRLTTQELWDIQNGILEDHVLSVAENLQLSQYIAYDCTTNTSTATIQSLMAVIAVIYIHEGTEKTRQFLQDYFISQLNENEIQQVIKLQHPKYILRSLSQKHRHEPVRLRLLRKKTSKDESAAYKVGAFKEDKCLAIGMASTSELAEKKACQNALRKIYPDDVRGFNFSYEAEDFESEDGIDLGLVTSHQRVITLDKEDKVFGFNIKGGEKKRLKNKDWLVYNYFTPIFISSLQPDSLADRLGSLRVGDVILAVNDKSLVGVDHATAVKVLQESTGTVTLTVQHSNEVLLTDRVETEFKKMKQRKRLAELTSEVWAEWHQAQADKHPEKYADVLNLKENVVAQ